VKRIVPAVILALATQVPASAVAGPSAETARRCMQYSYVTYPYKRPGSVRMSGDRQAYFKDCMEKAGNVPAPVSRRIELFAPGASIREFRSIHFD